MAVKLALAVMAAGLSLCMAGLIVALIVAMFKQDCD